MLPKKLNVISNKVLAIVVVCKCTIQVMLGITKWIDIQIQEQCIVTDFLINNGVCPTIVLV